MTAPTHSKHLKLSPLAIAIVAASTPAANVAAQEVRGIEEVIVTATKRSTNLQDVPHSISALTGGDLEKMGIGNMNDLIKALPSVYMQATTPGRNQLVMRGISTGSNEYRTDSQVAVYLDEQPMTTNSQQVGVRAIDMERIEALPGPQGTIFGSSSQTGTLRYITNKPDHDGLSGSIDASFGTISGGDNNNDLSGHLNIPLIDDVLSIRAVAYSSHEGGYVDNVLGSSLSGNFDNADVVAKDINENDVTGGRIAALWNMGDNWSTLFSVVAENNEAVGTWETDPFLGDHKITRFVDEWRTDDWYSLAFTTTGDLGFAELSLTATHFERDIAYEWDNNTYAQYKDRYYGGGLYYEAYLAGNPYYADYYNMGLYDSEYAFSTIVNDQRQERDTIELRLTSQGDSKLQWMVGGYYEDVHDEWFYYTRQPDLMNTRAWSTAQAYAYFYLYYSGYDGVQYPLPDTDIGYSNTMDRTVEQIAVFGELAYDLTDKLSITVGARWAEFERVEFDKYQFPQGIAPSGGFNNGGEFGVSAKSDDIIYKLGAKYNIDDDKMVYALFSQGFRLGGANSTRASNTGLIAKTYEPDFLDNYEVGFKTQWLNNRLQINASLFLMEWKDYHVSQSNIGKWWVRGMGNAPGAETTGLEASATWKISNNLSISGSVFMADPQFNADFDSLSSPGTLRIRDGMAMPNSPERKAYFSVDYDVPEVLGGDLWVNYNMSYQSENWNNAANVRTNNKNGLIPSWSHSNLLVGLSMPNGVELTMMVRNLFDEQSYSYVSTGSNSNSELFGDPRWRNVRSLEAPRTISLSFRKNF